MSLVAEYPIAGDDVVVGQTYLVPCVYGMPIVGDPHIDSDHYNYTPEHYHCDSRFHSGPDVDLCAVHTSRIREADRERQTDPNIFTGDEITLQPRVCLRAVPTVGNNPEAWLHRASLAIDFGHCALKNGRCPHRGMPVQNGVCTGHRLQWKKDGTAAHKGPFQLRIRGTNNVCPIRTSEDMRKMVIPIVESFSGTMVLDFEDGAGNIISSRPLGPTKLDSGDKYTVTTE